MGIVSQQRWISKLLGYDFVIQYKIGKEDRVRDALSQKFEDTLDERDLSISLLSFYTPSQVTKLMDYYLQDSNTNVLLLALQQGQLAPKGFSLQQGLILKKGRLWIVKGSL